MLDSIKKGQVVEFYGKTFCVNDIDTLLGLVWLKSDPEYPGNFSKVSVHKLSIVMDEAEPIDDETDHEQEYDFVPRHTKLEVKACLDEARHIQNKILEMSGLSDIKNFIDDRIVEIEKNLENATDDIFTSIVESHKVLCNIKQMGEKEAYGQNPAFYYAAAVSAESGECLNKMVKSLRDGGDANMKLLEAVKSELPDVIIYAFVLAYVLDIDLTKLVSEKANIVIKRAKSGYYGGPLAR